MNVKDLPAYNRRMPGNGRIPSSSPDWRMRSVSEEVLGTT